MKIINAQLLELHAMVDSLNTNALSVDSIIKLLDYQTVVKEHLDKFAKAQQKIFNGKQQLNAEIDKEAFDKNIELLRKEIEIEKLPLTKEEVTSCAKGMKVGEIRGLLSLI